MNPAQDLFVGAVIAIEGGKFFGDTGTRVGHRLELGRVRDVDRTPGAIEVGDGAPGEARPQRLRAGLTRGSSSIHLA